MSVSISIVTPSMNQGEFLEETIRSVISQQGDFKIDYIIMDGGSSDDSLSIIEKYDSLLSSGKWPVKCREIVFRWRSEPDDGQADALNIGFSLATGKLLGWLNSDDILLPGALNQIANVDWKKYGLCYGQGRWISRDGRNITAYPTFSPKKYSLYAKCTLCQPAVYFSRETFDRMGPLSLEYDLVFDYEYWLRAAFGGERFKRIPKMLAESRMYPENKSFKNSRAVEWESWQLRKTYFGDSKLNSPVLVIYRYVIEKITTRSEKKLYASLEERENIPD